MAKVAGGYFKDNFFNFVWLALIVIILGAGYYAWDSGIIVLPTATQMASNTESVILNDITPTENECSLIITPANVDEGDDVTGIIWTKDPLTFCEVFGKMEGDDSWIKVAEGTTDIDGNLVSVDAVYVSGDFTFAAICGDCRTNNDDLSVNEVSVSICEDSDGVNKLVPGNVKIDDVTMAYDECLNLDTVREYKCTGSELDYEILTCDDGYECIDTRSGGYCAPEEPETFDCTDSDGGLVYEVRGVCESSATMTGEIDTCSGTSIINEKFCSAIGTCITASIPCPIPGMVCVEGECRLL